MNIVKLQSQLQKVPDQALIGYVQNPDGQVPSYLALAELTRRKELRKSAGPQGEMPTQTVADQEVASVEPGVAGLPVRDDMYNEQAMAAGGIVAFEDGGEVPGFAAGDLIRGIKPLTGPRDYRFSLPSFPSFPSTEELNAYLADPQAYLANPQQYKAVAEQAAAAQAAPKTQAPYAGPYASNVDPNVVAQKQAELLKNRFAPVPAAPPPPSASGQPRGTGPAGLQYVPGADLSAEYDTMLRPEVSAQEAMNKYQGLLGTDVARERMKERLAGMEAKAAKDEERAPWMALAEAGLGMAAGRSQFALQNIAEGGKQGIKSYVDARDRLVKAEERRFDMANKVAQAERAEQVAAATYGLQSEEANKARNEANRMAKLGYKAERESTIAKGNFDAKKFNLEYRQREKEIGLIDKRIDKQIAATENQSLRYELQNRRESLKTAITQAEKELENETKALSPDLGVISKLRLTLDNYRNALYNMSIAPSTGAPSGKGALDPAGLKAFDSRKQ